MSFIFNKTPVLTNNENIKDIFYAFPIGIIIIDKETYFSSSSRILFANKYSRKILGIPKDNDMSLFMSKLSTFKEYDQSEKEDSSLRDIIFKSKEKSITKMFISPSKELIYVKIKRHHQKILLTIDDLQEDRKILQRKFSKSIGYEYLLTLYHEINNPLNSLIASVHEIIQRVESISVISKRIDLLACLIQFFLKNFISYFQVSIIDIHEKQNKSTFNLDSLFKQISNKFSMLFEYKKIKFRNSNFSFLNSKSTTMNYFYFKTLIKTIFTYFYHKVDKGGHFSISVEKTDNSRAKFVFSNAKKSESLTRSFSSLSDHERNKDTSKKNTIQTIEMMITIMNKLSELLGLQLEYSDSDIIFISLIVSYENQSKLLNEDEINEFSPCHQRVFSKLSRVIPKISLEELNNFRPTPDMLNDERSIIKRHTSKPFESLIKSKKKDLIKSLLKNIEMYNDNCNDNENDETHRDTQSMQDYHNHHLFNTSNDSSHLSNDSDKNNKKNNYNNSSSIQGRHSYIGKNQEPEKAKRKKQLSYSNTNFEIISPKNKNGFSFKCLPNTIKNINHTSSALRIIEPYNEDIDQWSHRHQEKNLFRTIKSSIVTDLPNISNKTLKVVNEKKDLLRETLPYSRAHIRNITEEDLEIESKSNNMSFSRMTFQNRITERMLYPPNKETNTVSRQGFYTEENTPQTSLFMSKCFLNTNANKDWTPKNEVPKLSQCKCCDVLVVDDEQFNLSCLTNLLNKLNIDCDIATNGKECLNQITRKSNRRCSCSKANYKLILLDILMPKVNGIEAAKEIIKKVTNGLLPKSLSIIFISACLDQESVVKELNKENFIVKEFISKPIKRNKIEDLIQKYYNND